MWWVRQVAQREQLSLLPPLLALRKEAEQLLAGLGDLHSEAAVRDLVADYNARVVDAIRRPHDGPLVAIPRRLDADQVVAEWTRRHSTPPAAAEPPPATAATPGLRLRRWWSRLIRRLR